MDENSKDKLASIYDFDIRKLAELYYKDKPKNHIDRYLDNNNRILRLLSFSSYMAEEIFKNDRDKIKEYLKFHSDILRAVIVFIHANLEEYIRGILKLELPKCESEILQEFPLAGKQKKKHSSKFNLGDLVNHKEKTVDQVISESINQSLDRTSFNSTNEISLWFEKVEIDISELKYFFPELDKMINRRHYIVHKADCEVVKDHTDPKPIEFDTVLNWFNVTMAFFETVNQKSYPEKDRLDIESILSKYKLSNIVKINKDND